MKRIFIIYLLISLLGLAFLLGCGKREPEKVRIGALKGPTTMGLLHFLEEQEEKEDSIYEFTMAVGADELLPLMVKGQLDIALIPANVASALYQKTEGDIAVVDINTLGVLYFVSSGETVEHFRDLEGKTIYLTGKGTTPEYVLTYLLEQAGITGYTLEFKSEPTEVVALLQKNPEAVGFLPQPFVSAALLQNSALKVFASAQELWEEYAGGESQLLTGVTVVRREFLENHEAVVEDFLQAHKSSTEWMNANAEEGAKLVVRAGIVGKEPIALRAIPECNLVCIQGSEMRKALEPYLKVLYEMNPNAVGGMLPGEDFYFEEQK